MFKSVSEINDDKYKQDHGGWATQTEVEGNNYIFYIYFITCVTVTINYVSFIVSYHFVQWQGIYANR